MKTLRIICLAAIGLFFSCSKEEPPIKPPGPVAPTCAKSIIGTEIETRNFNMGFTTWPYGPKLADVENTNEFIKNNGDIYSEHIDNKIPWDAWINDTALPAEFVNEIEGRKARKSNGLERLVSVSLLNTLRTDLHEDFDGSVPTYSAMNDQTIEDAYFKHLQYIIDNLEPDYFVLAMEANELYKNSAAKWEEYKLLMANIRARIKNDYPDLMISESMTLHNWFEPDVSDPETFINEINTYVGQLDFVAISFYPFFKGQHNKAQFQSAFDFLHSAVSKPIAFVETSHLAEDLIVNSLSLFIPGNVCEQRSYLETLLINAEEQDYLFVIWWAHRDFDALWQTFPAEVKDLGKLWRDTGLLDESGNKRPAYFVWKTILNK